MWFALSGMSDYDTTETGEALPNNLDIWISKSTDRGLNWMEPLQITDTENENPLLLNTEGYPNDARLESGVHLASQGTDETVGVFYQMAEVLPSVWLIYL